MFQPGETVWWWSTSSRPRTGRFDHRDGNAAGVITKRGLIYVDLQGLQGDAPCELCGTYSANHDANDADCEQYSPDPAQLGRAS